MRLLVAEDKSMLLLMHSASSYFLQEDVEDVQAGDGQEAIRYFPRNTSSRYCSLEYPKYASKQG